MKCCVSGCKKNAVTKGVCIEHSDKDTRICLGGCERWMVKKSKHHGLCETCSHRNESLGGQRVHKVILGR